ncbi:MAG: hypothetical protein FWD31_03865 [Planctomycetaceae bacterium]|nr:hypothetical protein [Planctomycetaceae bacterium]
MAETHNHYGSKLERYSVNGKGRAAAFSLIRQKNLRQLYLVAESSPEGDLESRFTEIRDTFAEVLTQQKMSDSAVAMSIFVSDIGQKQFLRQKFCEFFGNNLPATTYIPQTSCFGDSFIVELFAVNGENSNFSIKRHCENIVQVFADDMAVLFCGDIRSDEAPLLSYDRSLNAIQKMQNYLHQEGYDISDLYRTWLYQGHIVDAEGDTQRYKELNRARSDVFHGQQFITQFLPQVYRGIAFPSSTGIGANDYDLVISCQAIKSQRDDLIIVPLENPMQVSAFDYGEVYSPKSPKFSRAMAFVAGNDAKVYISGTASITDSESRFEGDPIGQTNQTLDNIAALVTPENLARHGVNGFGATLEHFAVARVYVKNRGDFPVIRQVCEQRMPETPIVYTYADVCRPELLVEIEGVIVPDGKGNGC